MARQVGTRINTLLITLLVAAVFEGLWPALVTAQTRLVAVGDVHGDFDALSAILQEAEIIDANWQWVGGNTTLIQTGDLLDRGMQDREVMDLFMALEQQAPRAGGRVVVLLGNHELMNLMGDLRYTRSYSSFADTQSEQRRSVAYQRYLEWRKQRTAALHQPPPRVTKEMERQWKTNHVRGFVERVDAFAPNGRYGQWLRTLPAIVQIDSTIFLHGGLSPTLSPLDVDSINAQIKQEIDLFDQYKQHLVETGVILPFFTLDEMTKAVQAELDAVTAAAQDPARTYQDNEHAQVLSEFLDSSKWLSVRADGPLWFRGFAKWAEDEGAANLETLREVLGNVRFVAGHSVQPDGRIHARFGGKVFLIDTGMTRSHRGQASALEFRNGTVTAIYLNQRTVLVDDTSPSAPSVPIPQIK